MSAILILLLVLGTLGLGLVLYLSLRKKSPSGVTSYQWVTSDPSPGSCSLPCGGGVSYRKVECTAVQDGVSINAPVDRCDPTTKPPEMVPCNTQPCSWTIGDWSSCSEPCGGGTQTRTVTCTDPKGDCGPTPPTEQSCNTQSCTWNVGAWSECKTESGETVTCGTDSKKSRTVSCPREDVMCGVKPDEIESCTLPFCAWKAADWDPANCVSAFVCGKGTQNRIVTCNRSSKNCDPTITPPASQVCDTGRVCTWASSEKWYPYPVPSLDMFNPQTRLIDNVSLLTVNNQNFGVTVEGSGSTETLSPSILKASHATKPEGWVLITNSGFNTNTDGSPLISGDSIPQYYLGFMYDTGLQDIIAVIYSTTGYSPIQLYKSDDGTIAMKNGKGMTAYYPKPI